MAKRASSLPIQWPHWDAAAPGAPTRTTLRAWASSLPALEERGTCSIGDADGAQDDANVHADGGGRADEDDHMVVDEPEAEDRPMGAGNASEVEMSGKAAEEGACKESESSSESDESSSESGSSASSSSASSSSESDASSSEEKEEEKAVKEERRSDGSKSPDDDSSATADRGSDDGAGVGSDGEGGEVGSGKEDVDEADESSDEEEGPGVPDPATRPSGPPRARQSLGLYDEAGYRYCGKVMNWDDCDMNADESYQCLRYGIPKPNGRYNVTWCGSELGRGTMCDR
ncbi:hypothetical protein EV715DRAFT_214858 [Schizophyllum commune]